MGEADYLRELVRAELFADYLKRAAKHGGHAGWLAREALDAERKAMRAMEKREACAKRCDEVARDAPHPMHLSALAATECAALEATSSGDG